MTDKIKLENKENIQLWENLGSADPFWGVLSHKNKKNSMWDLKEFYDTGSGDINELLKLLKDANSFDNIKNVLDFGCGVGRLTKHISKIFPNVFALDISKGMLQNAIKNNLHDRNTLFIQYNSTEIPFIKNNTIDLIISIITFQHIHEQIQLKYLKDFLRILSNNGMIYVQLVHGYQNNFKGFILRIFGDLVFKVLHKFRYDLDYPMKIYILREKNFMRVILDNNIEIIKKANTNTTGTPFRSSTYLLRVKK